MRVEINEKLVKRNRQMATYLFMSTLILLIGGFFFVNAGIFTGEIINDPIILILQVLILPLAFIMTLFSVRMTNLWARPPRPEDALADGFKGLSKKSIVYHYHHIPARHILIAPQGVFVIKTQWHNGKYSNNGDTWQTIASPFSKFFASIRMDGLRNPTWDVQRQADYVKGLLKDIAPDVEVKPLIVFVDPMARVTIKDPVVPVLYSDKHKPNIKDYLRQLNQESPSKELPLSQEQIEAFEKLTLPAKTEA